MEKKKTLLQEIIEKVLEKLTSNVSFGTVKWMLVSKHLDIYQKFVYKAISIDFNSPNDIMFTNIMHSHFNPGQFVQHVNFRTLAAPDTFNQQVDLETDNLYQFMKKCRGVKNVTISPDHHGGIIRKTISWKYLKKVLVSSGDIWKLRSLPEINSLYYGYIYYSQRYYYDYAYYLRNSLVKLCLTGGMVGFDGNMLTSLKDFKVLENLKIVNLIDSIDTEELNILLTRYLPKYVKKLSIEFVPLDMEEEMEFNTTTEE